MHLGDLSAGGNLAGADRPDRLVRDRKPGCAFGISRQGAIKLRRDRLDRRSPLADLEGLTDTEDDAKPCRKRRFCLCPYLVVSFPLGIAPFALSNDCEGGAGIHKHLRRSATGVGAFFRMVHVLTPDQKIGDPARSALEKNCRHAQRDVDGGIVS